jgi:hypothetical protein
VSGTAEVAGSAAGAAAAIGAARGSWPVPGPAPGTVPVPAAQVRAAVDDLDRPRQYPADCAPGAPLADREREPDHVGVVLVCGGLGIFGEDPLRRRFRRQTIADVITPVLPDIGGKIIGKDRRSPGTRERGSSGSQTCGVAQMLASRPPADATPDTALLAVAQNTQICMNAHLPDCDPLAVHIELDSRGSDSEANHSA